MQHYAKPPEHFASWLDYAVATMDTRSAYQQYLLSASESETPSRNLMRAAVVAELRALRAAAGVADTLTARAIESGC